MDGWSEGRNARKPLAGFQGNDECLTNVEGFSDRKSATNGLRRKAAAPAPALYIPTPLSSVTAALPKIPRLCHGGNLNNTVCEYLGGTRAVEETLFKNAIFILYKICLARFHEICNDPSALWWENLTFIFQRKYSVFPLNMKNHLLHNFYSILFLIEKKRKNVLSIFWHVINFRYSHMLNWMNLLVWLLEMNERYFKTKIFSITLTFFLNKLKITKWFVTR